MIISVRMKHRCVNWIYLNELNITRRIIKHIRTNKHFRTNGSIAMQLQNVQILGTSNLFPIKNIENVIIVLKKKKILYGQRAHKQESIMKEKRQAEYGFKFISSQMVGLFILLTLANATYSGVCKVFILPYVSILYTKNLCHLENEATSSTRHTRPKFVHCL